MSDRFVQPYYCYINIIVLCYYIIVLCLLLFNCVLGGAAAFSEGFVICFLKVPLACLGNMVAAVQPNSLGNSKKKVNKTFGTSGRFTRYNSVVQIFVYLCWVALEFRCFLSA